MGLPDHRLFIKPHFAPAGLSPLPWNQREEKAVYVGRLYEAKGVHVLLKAWKLWGNAAPRLEIIGDGPLMQNLRCFVEEESLSEKVSFRGVLSSEETHALLSSAKLLIVPSLCPEGFPMVVAEAFALGVPIAASRIGSLQTLVDDRVTGILFEPGNEIDMQQKTAIAWTQAERWGESARRVAVERYSADRNHERLMSIYEEARSTNAALSA